jgi:hypothetical protein
MYVTRRPPALSGPSSSSSKGVTKTRIGDQWTFVALDPDTKLVLAYLVGKRTRENAVDFMFDLSNSSDSFRSYVDAVEQAFGADVDYGQIVKFFDPEPIGPGRYAPLPPL